MTANPRIQDCRRDATGAGQFQYHQGRALESRNWRMTDYAAYRDALHHLELLNVALADVTTPWMELLKQKPFSDLSGNNVNHPNDFGHRLYAQVICQLLPSENSVR